jgi:hypothetical protein
MAERRFPVLLRDGERQRLTGQRGSVTVPWSFVAPHEAWAKRNHGQDLDTLARRGGLDPIELLAIVTGTGAANSAPLLSTFEMLCVFLVCNSDALGRGLPSTEFGSDHARILPTNCEHW